MKDGIAHLRVRLAGAVDPAFYRKAARCLRRMLCRTAATLTLHVDDLCEGQRRPLDRLLLRLAPYGDRVSIRVNQRVQPLLAIDSSVFHFVVQKQ